MIKVCGMREAENIREVEALGIDMMGFIFWPKSGRYVSEQPEYLPTKCQRVGVFVDEDPGLVKRIANSYGLDYVQLHGHESPDYLHTLRAAWSEYGCNTAVPHIIKAFNISTSDDFTQTKAYEGLVDYFLFDTKGKSVGGNGEKFDWSVLEHYTGETPFLLSGGIGPDDTDRVKTFHHPKCIGIDLNSRFEVSPGLKDVNKLKSFIQKYSYE